MGNAFGMGLAGGKKWGAVNAEALLFVIGTCRLLEHDCRQPVFIQRNYLDEVWRMVLSAFLHSCTSKR